jgi:UDP-2,3-diacylglucosamine pyrophosphatase LpxH
MSRNDDAIIKRLNELYKVEEQSIKKLPLNINDKYALFSDLHLGDGGKVDNFVHNEETMEFALNYYKNKEYSVILLGDLEELWQFDFIKIKDRYDKSIYDLLRRFSNNKVHRIFGNHDKEWKRPPDPILNDENVPNRTPEAIMLGDDIFLLHGHQGDQLCDRNVWLSSFVARCLKFGVPFAKAFGYENRSATKSQIPKSREKLYYNWAKDNKVILICGHTHNAIFASRSYYWWLKEQIKQKELEKKRCLKEDKIKRKELSKVIKGYKKNLHNEEKMGRNFNRIAPKGKPLPCYFNTGCGLYRKGITNIEIEGDKIRLIKWQSDNSLPSEKRRKKLWGEERLSELREKINI